MVETLLRYKPDPDVINNDNMTPLAEARRVSESLWKIVQGSPSLSPSSALLNA